MKKANSKDGNRISSILLAILLISGTIVVSAPMAVFAGPPCDGQTVTIAGTNGVDVIIGTTGDDVIDGGMSEDIIIGNGGNDTICGGAGEDTIITGAGNDRIFGEGSYDTIDAGDGANYVEGGASSDIITTGSGADTIDGGTNDDAIFAGDGNNNVLGDAANDYITTGSGDDIVSGGTGDDCIDSGTGTDTVDGGGELGDLVNVGICNLPSDIIPTISISAPADSSTYDDTQLITFTGVAADSLGLDLTANIQWYYGNGGIATSLGSGASVSSTLPQGTHTIVAYVVDPNAFLSDPGLELRTSVATITLTITAPGGNIAPTAVNDLGNVDDLSSVTVNVAANDSDPDGTLDLASVIITGSVNGTATSNGDGTVTYTHTGGTSTGFRYTIDDNLGATSNIAQVTITVNPVNLSPVATDDTGDVANLGSTTINVGSNDSDPDGTLDLSAIIITANGANGNAVSNGDGTVTYTHTNDGTTTDSFNYTIADDLSAVSNEATVTISVTTTNIAPTAVNDYTNVNILEKVILNATSNDSDSDGTLDLATLTIIDDPLYGTALANLDGTFNYTHTQTTGVLDSFTYTIDDDNGKTSNQATVTITVVLPNSDSTTSTQSVEDFIEQKELEMQEERQKTILEFKEQFKQKQTTTKENQGNGKPTQTKEEILTKNDQSKLNFEVFEIVNTFFEETDMIPEGISEESALDSKTSSSTVTEETVNDPVNELDSNQQSKSSKSNKSPSQSQSQSSQSLPDETMMQKAAKRLGLQYKHGETKVVVELKEDTKEAIEEIQNIAKIDVKSKKNVQVTVGIDKIPKLVKNPSIEKMRAPLDAVQFELEYPTSEGVFFINADLVHQTGMMGEGIKVAVLDLSFDKDNPKITDQVTKTESFRQGFEYTIDLMGMSQEDGHGTAVAEIVSDVAPKAELYLYTFGTDVEFERAVDEAMSDNVDIIVMSAGWPSLPTDGESHVTKKVEEAISNGITFVVPSGNFAEKHWEGEFVDGNKNSWHEFNAKDEGLNIEVSKEQVLKQEPILIYLMWDKQEIVNDFDLVLVGPTGNIEDYSIKEQKSQGDSLSEFINFIPTIPGKYSIGISFTGEKFIPASLEIFSLFNTLEHQIKQGSVTVPTDAQGAMVVGAVNYFDGKVESFSSQGPTNIGQKVPHVVGPDGVTTLSLENKPFHGTSATAPYIAGLAALLIQSNPEINVEQVFIEIIENTKSDNITVKDTYDYIFGYGKADATFLAE